MPLLLLSKPKGWSLISLVVGFLIIVMGSFIFARNIVAMRKHSLHLRQTLVAEMLAVELLEFLRSFTPDGLRTYLSTNPVNATKNPYPLCAHINLLDRTNSTPSKILILNRHPAATLPISPLSDASNPMAANRYFQIQVVNARTLGFNRSYCDKRMTQICLFNRICSVGQTQLSEHERFLLTVGVSWFPKGKTTDVRRIVLLAITPEP